MSIELIIEGDQAIIDRLNEIVEQMSSGPYWQRKLVDVMEKGRRYAVSISPVITGAYADSHEVVQNDMGATIRVNPDARNPTSGERVTRYAGIVERRHTVYARTADHVRHLVQDMEVL